MTVTNNFLWKQKYVQIKSKVLFLGVKYYQVAKYLIISNSNTVYKNK